MRICAIISEYNPLHYGHAKHIAESKIRSGADAIMCIMAGNFCQRGEPSVVNKHVRSRMAIEAGADIVVQLPTAYACSSAEIFALAGVKVANSFENITHLSFGCETTNYDLLTKVSRYLYEEPKEYKTALQKHLKAGSSLPTARESAMADLVDKGMITFGTKDDVLEILRQPNNILAIEYLKALYRTDSKIQPLFIHRKDSNFLSEDLSGRDTSATAIRTRLYKKGNVKSVKKLVPKSTYNYLKQEIKHFGLPSVTTFNDICLYVLKTMQAHEMQNIYDVTEGLENSFIDSARKFKDLQELLLDVKSKRYTYTRLRRIVLRMVLKIEKDIIAKLYNMDTLPFIKVLAFKSERKELLRAISANTTLIIRNNNIDKNPSKEYATLALIEDNANAFYNLLLKKNKSIPNYAPDLYTKTIIY